MTARSIDVLFFTFCEGEIISSPLPELAAMHNFTSISICIAPTKPPPTPGGTRDRCSLSSPLSRLSLSFDCYLALKFVTAGVRFFLNRAEEKLSIFAVGSWHFFCYFFLFFFLFSFFYFFFLFLPVEETTHCQLTPTLLALVWTAESLVKKISTLLNNRTPCHVKSTLHAFVLRSVPPFNVFFFFFFAVLFKKEKKIRDRGKMLQSLQIYASGAFPKIVFRVG